MVRVAEKNEKGETHCGGGEGLCKPKGEKRNKLLLDLIHLLRWEKALLKSQLSGAGKYELSQ